MAVSSAAQVAARMNQVAGATRKVQQVTVVKASDALKSAVLASSPGRVRNASKSGGRLSVSVKSTAGAEPSSSGKAAGPWPLIEYDIPTHLIGIGRATTGRGATRKGKNRAKVKISNGAAIGGILHGSSYAHPVRGPVVHPGTTGKMVFHKGVARGTPRAVAAMRSTNLQAVREAFG